MTVLGFFAVLLALNTNLKLASHSIIRESQQLVLLQVIRRMNCLQKSSILQHMHGVCVAARIDDARNSRS